MAAVFAPQRSAAAALFAVQRGEADGSQTVVVPLVDAGTQAYAPSVAIVGPQSITVPLVDGGRLVFEPNLSDSGLFWPIVRRRRR